MVNMLPKLVTQNHNFLRRNAALVLGKLSPAPTCDPPVTRSSPCPRSPRSPTAGNPLLVIASDLQDGDRLEDDVAEGLPAYEVGYAVGHGEETRDGAGGSR